MGTLNASPSALRQHATLCEGLAGDLGSATVPAYPVTGHQSTTAAVAALHAGVITARAAMADRMTATAAAVHASADGLDAHESNSATALRSPAQ